MGKDLKGKELGKGISQRADGRYIARFTSKTGKRKTLYDFKLNELKRKLREAVYEDEHGLNGNGESITLNAWYVTWTELYKKKTVKMTTIYKNHSYYNARVKNSIGKMYLQDIKTYHVQKFINELIDSGLAHGTVSNIRFMLSDMFDKAVLSEYIRKNPCIGVEMPKEVKKERRVLTREEQEKFFTFASSYIHINVLKFAVTTGCRIGEVLGLKWEDCDFERRKITINKTIHYSKASSPVEGSKFFYTTAKTISSNRVIPMTDEVYEILQNQKIKQTEQKMWKRSIWRQHKEFQNLVFTCSDGSPVYYYNVNSAIKDYVAKINVIEIELAKEEKREPKIFELFTCHTLRHTYATRCYENGVDQQVVQKLLGHSTLAMTTDLYTHVSEEKKKEEIFYDKKKKDHYMNHMFHGYDMDRTMLRIGAMNMMTHGIDNPFIEYRDSLSDQNQDKEQYSLVLANPPFKGSLDAESVSGNLLKVCKTKKTELLFLTLFLRILKIGGRCACIVPDGVLFGSSKAHKSIRKEIVENQRLEAVISMPSGVFKPYAGVSTAILIFTKTEHGGTDHVWFYDMKADGFSLDDKRSPIAENDIPDIIERFKNLDKEMDRKRTDKSFMVPKQDIVDNDYDLSINKYKEIEYVPVEYPPTSEIMANIRELEMEIGKEMDELERLLEL